MPFEVPFIVPSLPAAELVGEDFARIQASGWYSNFGPFERRFAAAIAERIGPGFSAVTSANATTALIGLVKAVLGRGDGTREVIVPSFTFAAGPAAIEWAGYRPLLIDIELPDLQPSLDEARSALADPARSIAGILLANSFGIGNSQIGEWEELAATHDVPLLIDSAAGFGSRYADGTPVGRAGTAEVFSFHATKSLAIGEGGAVVTRDAELAARLQALQNFGFVGGEAVELGFNGKLQEINAAIGLRQLDALSDILSGRQAVVARYRAALGPLGVELPAGIETSAVCFATVLFPDRGARDAAAGRLATASVESRTYYHPAIHRHPHFSETARVSSLAGTEEASGRVLSLPVHTGMAAEAVERVIGAISGGDA